MKKIVQKSILLIVLNISFNFLTAQVPTPALTYFTDNCKALYFSDTTAMFMPKVRYSILSQKVKFGDGDSMIISSSYNQHNYANTGTYNLCYFIKFYDSLTSSSFTDSTCYSMVLNCNRTCSFNKFFFNYEDSTSCKIGKFSFYSHAYSYGYHLLDLKIFYGDGGVDSINNYSTTTFYKLNHTYTLDSNYLVKVYMNFYDTINNVVCIDSLSYYANIDCNKCNIKSKFQVFEDQNDCKKINIYDYYTPGAIFKHSFGDGSSSIGRNPSHSYAIDSNYIITSYVSFYDSSRNLWCYDTSIANIKIDCKKCKLNAIINLIADSSTTYKALLYNFTTGNITSQKWLFGDGDSSTLKAPTHIYTSSGTFTLKYIAYDSIANCRDTSVITFTIDSSGNIKRGKISYILQVIDKTQNSTNINKIEKKYAVKLFPNPANRLLNITFEKPLAYEIYDAKGALIFQDKNNYEIALKIDISTWAKGLYILKCQSGESFKFIIE